MVTVLFERPSGGTCRGGGMPRRALLPTSRTLPTATLPFEADFSRAGAAIWTFQGASRQFQRGATSLMPFKGLRGTRDRAVWLSMWSQILLSAGCSGNFAPLCLLAPP